MENNNNIQQEEITVTPTEPSVEEKTDRHEQIDVENKSIEYKEENKEPSILFPMSTYSKLIDFIKVIDTIPVKEFEKAYSKKQAISAGVNIESMRTTTMDDIFVDNLNEKLDDFINLAKYSDKELTIRPLNFKQKDGAISGQAAVARFTSLLGVGEVTQVPLWHSGIWLTIKPPKQSDIINLELAIANNQISLGRDTNTLVYSNYSVIFNRLVTDFVMKHVVDTTLKITEEDDLRDYIVIHDLYPLILGMITSMYPDGIPITRTCINTKELNEDKTPKCDFTVSSKVDTKKLLFVNRKSISNNMLSHMSKRSPNSMTVDEVKEYQLSIKESVDKKITIKTENSLEITAILSLPMLKDYVINGEAWVLNIIKESEELFSKTDSDEVKNSKVNDILMTVILGIYNVFVKKIETNGSIVEDRETITEVLTVLSNDNEAFKSFINEVKKFISRSAIAIVATPNYECPKCKAEQTDSNLNKAFKELIPLNVLESFFDLSVLRINKVRNKSMY